MTQNGFEHKAPCYTFSYGDAATNKTQPKPAGYHKPGKMMARRRQKQGAPLFPRVGCPSYQMVFGEVPVARACSSDCLSVWISDAAVSPTRSPAGSHHPTLTIAFVLIRNPSISLPLTLVLHLVLLHLVKLLRRHRKWQNLMGLFLKLTNTFPNTRDTLKSRTVMSHAILWCY